MLAHDTAQKGELPAALRIGDLARETGKTVRTLRYYEEIGLLFPTGHTTGGFRLYKPDDVKRVQLIERLQELGFSLERIREIVAAWREGTSGTDVASRLNALLHEGLQEIRARMRRLLEMEREMVEALRFVGTCASCQEHPGPSVCSECRKGDHQAHHLPSLVDALVR